MDCGILYAKTMQKDHHMDQQILSCQIRIHFVSSKVQIIVFILTIKYLETLHQKIS